MDRELEAIGGGERMVNGVAFKLCFCMDEGEEVCSGE